VLVSFVGVILLTPVLTRPAAFLLRRLLARTAPSRLGLLNTGRNPRRTANAAAALMVGLTVVAGISVIAASSKASLTRQFGRDAGADIFVSAEFGGSNPGQHTFDPAVLARARQIPGVREVAGQYSDDATVNGRPAGVSSATDPAAFARLFGITAVAGTLDVRAADHAVVSPGTAKEYGVHVGSTATIQLSRGAPRTVTVVGIYQTALFGGWYVSPALVGDFAVQRLDFGVINVADGTDVAEVRRQVEHLLVDTPDILASDRSAFAAQLTRQIDRALVYIRLLLGLSILIATFGIVNTLALSVIERTREIGLLRVIGLRRAQTVRMIGTEAVVISTFGAVLGLAVGTGLGTAVARALRHNGIPDLAYPWTHLAAYLGLAVGVGVLAAVLPAIRAARTDILTAVAQE
jgi:putative ABC transport system permease protein